MKKILTIILDGFGMREDIYGNAVKNAGMNNFINLWNKYPHCLLSASSKAIGLPSEQCSCSEMGHKVIGSGQKINSNLNIINDAISKNLLLKNEKFNQMLNYLNQTKKKLHIISLISDGGVSSHIDHLRYIINVLNNKKISNVHLHLITDGQDSSKYSSKKYISDIEQLCGNDIKISTICGRYYALDKNGDYNRTKTYYELLINGHGVKTPSISRIIDMCYEKKLSDEYLPPIKTSDYIPFDNNDVVLMLNYSKKNQIQLLQFLANKKNEEFNLESVNLKLYSFFEITNDIKTNNFFTEEKIENTLCEYIDNLGLSQARIVESLKKDSMTYYLDGCRRIKIDNCDTYVIPSIKIENIDKKPAMNALAIAKTIIKCMDNDYDFIIANFANPDEIGHTGNYQATINGLQAIDVCLGKILEVAEDNFYKVIIVGDHAKADTIIDRDNNIITKNTLNPVPFIIVDKKMKLYNGDLTMVAPTILKYMDIALPKNMKNNRTLFEEE